MESRVVQMENRMDKDMGTLASFKVYIGFRDNGEAKGEWHGKPSACKNAAPRLGVPRRGSASGAKHYGPKAQWHFGRKIFAGFKLPYKQAKVYTYLHVSIYIYTYIYISLYVYNIYIYIIHAHTKIHTNLERREILLESRMPLLGNLETLLGAT